MSQDTFAALGVSADPPQRSKRAASPAPSRSRRARFRPRSPGTDLLAKSPTGSGKTLAFAIPLVERVPRDDARPAALVLVPTRELAVQVSTRSRRSPTRASSASPPCTAESRSARRRTMRATRM